MSRIKPEDGLSARDLKQKMYHSLQSSGVVNQLKGYLRQSVINELRGKTKESSLSQKSDLLAATISNMGNASWNRRVLDNIVLHHLKQSRYLYSLSLFQQESSVKNYDESLTQDLLQHLGVSPDLLKQFKEEEKENDLSMSFQTPDSSSTPVGNMKGEKMEARFLLWKILSNISSAQHLVRKLDQDTFMESEKNQKPQSLADKLQAVDDEMDATARDRQYGDIEYRKSIATLASATRRAEEAADKRARESLEQWKRVEFASLKVQETEKTKELVAEKTKQLEEEYSRRKDNLMQREQNAIERLNNQKELLEKDLHHQRQLLLQELEQIGVREKALREKEQFIRDVETVKLRELEMMKSEFLSQQGHTIEQGQMSMEKSRRDSVVSSCADSLRKSLTGRESRQLDEVLKELNSRSEEAEILRRELSVIREELAQTKSKMDQFSHPRVETRTRASNYSPRNEESNSQFLRKRLDDLAGQLNEWKEHDKATRESAIQAEIGRWREEVTKLSDARDQLDAKQRQLDEMTLRLNTKMNSSNEKTPRVLQNPASNLRILMDPQEQVPHQSSIRDYEPVSRGHVRWSDRMPYTIQPSMLDKGQPSTARVPDSCNIGLDDSNETTSSSSSSRDISTASLRTNIQQQFSMLEKESEELEQIYKRYIHTNYKHIPSDIPYRRSPISSPRYTTRSGTRSSVHRESSTLYPGPTTGTGQGSPKTYGAKPSSPPAKSQEKVLPEYKPTSNLSSRNKDQTSDDHTPGLKLGGELLVEEKSRDAEISDVCRDEIGHITNEIPTLEIGSRKTDEEGTDSRRKNLVKADVKKDEKFSASTVMANKSSAPDDNFHPTTNKSSAPDDNFHPTMLLEKLSGGTVLPLLQSRSGAALPPISQKSSIPPATHLSLDPQSIERTIFLGKNVRTPPDGEVLVSNNIVEELSDQIGKSHLEEVCMKDQSLSESLSFAEESLPLNMSSLNPNLKQQDANDPEVSFERPALLSSKKDELSKSLELPVTLKSPKHDTDLALGFHDDDGLQNILDSIDINSARSLEEETDSKLADLLNQVEQNPNMTSQKMKGREFPEFQEEKNQERATEDRLNLKSTGITRNDEISSISKTDQDEKLLSDRSNEYSDKFLSSDSSKTSSIVSEIKTMSDFDPSSTSFPRIEDKVANPHQSGDEAETSGAEVHWSNLQLDKSGEIRSETTPKEQQQQQQQKTEDPNEGNEETNIDVFNDSQSTHSFEAPSDGAGKRSASSEEEFW